MTDVSIVLNEKQTHRGSCTGTENAPSLAAVMEQLRFNGDGLIPVIVQDDEDNTVLMLAWMNREAIARTVAEGRAVYWSRSRGEFWRKGDTSGHVQYLRSLAYDCDADTLLLRVTQIGAACHNGTRSCFTQQIVAQEIEEETYGMQASEQPADPPNTE